MRDADEAETRAEQRDKSSGETSHKRVENSAETSAEQSRKEAQGAEVESRKGARAKTGRVAEFRAMRRKKETRAEQRREAILQVYKESMSAW